jgi:hypothetical protein
MNSSALTAFIWALASAVIAADLLWWLVVPAAVEAWKEYLDGPDYMDVYSEHRPLFRGIKSLSSRLILATSPNGPATLLAFAALFCVLILAAAIVSIIVKVTFAGLLGPSAAALPLLALVVYCMFRLAAHRRSPTA